MRFVNRGYIHVRPTKVFIDWANKNDEDYSDLESNEASVYLIEEDFLDDEPVLKANFKSIFFNELYAITEDESLFPEINFENFQAFFDVEMGSTVFDVQDEDLKRD